METDLSPERCLHIPRDDCGAARIACRRGDGQTAADGAAMSCWGERLQPGTSAASPEATRRERLGAGCEHAPGPREGAAADSRRPLEQRRAGTTRQPQKSRGCGVQTEAAGHAGRPTTQTAAAIPLRASVTQCAPRATRRAAAAAAAAGEPRACAQRCLGRLYEAYRRISPRAAASHGMAALAAVVLGACGHCLACTPPQQLDVLLHGNSIANKRAAMLAAQCAAAAASSSVSLPPPPATAASATSSTAAQPVAVFGAAADEMTDSCRLATPPQRAPTRLSITDAPSSLWSRRSAQPLHRVLLSQRYTNVALGEAVVMLPLPADAAADVAMAEAPAGCACAADAAPPSSPAAAAPPAPALPEPAKPGLRRRPRFLDAEAAAAGLPALADAAESESDAATSAPPCKSTTTTSGRKRARDADAAAASAAQAGCCAAHAAAASGQAEAPAEAVAPMEADAPADVTAAVHLGARPVSAWWRCCSLVAALGQPPWVAELASRALA